MVRSGEWASPGERVAMATPADLFPLPSTPVTVLVPTGTHDELQSLVCL